MMKTLLLGLAATGVLLGCAMPAFSDSAGAIAAHVQVASPCIIVTPSSIDFGTATFANLSGVGFVVARLYQIDPCGQSETILVRGTPATSDPVGVTWNLGNTTCAPGQTNVYATFISLGTGAKYVTVANQVLASVGGSPLGGSLRLTPPCVGSDGAGRLMNFSYIFTATF